MSDASLARRRRAVLAALAISAALVVGACGGGVTTSTAQGTLRVALTDAPACGFDHVYVTVERIRVHASADASEGGSGWTDIGVNPPKKIDLLGLTNGVMEALGQTPINAGDYTQVRLVLGRNFGSTLANSVVPTGGSETALSTPSAAQSGIKVIRPFTVSANKIADLVLDFDACRSIVRRGNGSFSLKPVVTAHLVDAAAIAGNVDPAVSGASVSVQKAGNVIRSTVPAGTTGAFSVPFLDPSNAPYDVVITAAGRASAVVTGVPVTGGAVTTVSTTAQPITLPTSVTRTASGTVGPSAARATAEVRALQAAGAVAAFEVSYSNVDEAAGSYALSLPVAAPLLATYSTTLPLSFAPQTGTAGKYTLQARATGYTTQSVAIDVAAANVTRDFALVTAP